MQTIQLRDVQIEALDKVAEEVARGGRRILGAAPTGFGKTIVFSHLRAHLNLNNDARVLILAHRDELVQQAVEKYQHCMPGTLIGIEKGPCRATPMDRVIVASVQTLKHPRLDEFIMRWGRPELLITDEAHHAIAPSYREIYDTLGVTAHGTIIHIGVTATPRRGDNIGLEGVFDTIAFSYTIGDIIDRGYLVPLAGYRVETTTDLDKVHTVAGDFNERELANAVDNPVRNARVVAAYRDLAGGKKALCFAVNIEHSQNLQMMFEAAGFRAAHVDGTMKIEDRRRVLADFHDGKYDVLCNCNVLTEGYDEPTVECIIVARPTKSGALYTQIVGRGTRLSDGKQKCIIIDIVDATKRHSVANLATLLGLPPTFDLKGRSATKASKTYEKIVKESPLASMFIKDAKTLEDLEGVDADERVKFLVKALLDGAKKSQQYVSVDLLKPAELPAEMSRATMTWVPVGEDRYLIQIDRNEVIIINADALGHWNVEHRNGTREMLGIYPNVDAARTAGEAWVRTHRPARVALLAANTRWRGAPASDAQLAALRKFRIQPTPGMTKGEASNALDIVMAAIARGERSAR